MHAKSGTSCKLWASGVSDVSVPAYDCNVCTAVVRHDHGGEDSACGKTGSIQGLSALHTGGLPGNVYLLPNIKPTAKLAVSVLSVEDSPGAEHALDGL